MDTLICLSFWLIMGTICLIMIWAVREESPRSSSQHVRHVGQNARQQMDAASDEFLKTVRSLRERK